MRKLLIDTVCCFFVVLCFFPEQSLGAKKDYKGMFGSFRKERFTENEGKATSFGMDVMLSTLFPLTDIVTSTEPTVAESALNYASFFNFEITAYMNLAYHWQLYGRLGSYNYETRKENEVFTDPTLPLFHEFTMTAVPLVGGIRYRFSRSDVVPYVGVGVGIVYTDQLSGYDYSTTSQRVYSVNLAGEATLGLEFYFSSRAGIRLESNVFFMQLDSRTFAPGSSSSPSFNIKGNPLSLRYASGIFVLF